MKAPAGNRIVWAGIAVISLAMLVGPLFSPGEFSWMRHSTSEQAGQHMPGAWLMRAGFVAYGSSIVLAAIFDWRAVRLVRLALVLFGIGLIGTAVWSNAPIVKGLPADMAEDRLHSIASGVVGTAFALACAARLFAPGGNRRDAVAWIGLLVSVLVPMLMVDLPQVRGLLQRLMFAYSFLFVLREFAQSRQRSR